MDETQQPPSLGSSVHRLADTILSTLRNRLELLGIELAEEKQWFLSALCWAAIGLFTSFAAILVITFTAIILVPEGIRTFVALGFCILYVVCALLAVAMVRQKLKRRPPPFQDTVGELRKDLDCLRTRE